MSKTDAWSWDVELFNCRPVHTLSFAFRHLPPNSARNGYATEGALLTPRSCLSLTSLVVSVVVKQHVIYLLTDAVSAL